MKGEIDEDKKKRIKEILEATRNVCLPAAARHTLKKTTACGQLFFNRQTSSSPQVRAIDIELNSLWQGWSVRRLAADVAVPFALS